MSAVDSYRESIREYGEWEFSLLKAWMHGHLTRDEYRVGRRMAYLAHGYIDPARASVRRQIEQAAA